MAMLKPPSSGVFLHMSPGSAISEQVSAVHASCPCGDGQALDRIPQGTQCPVTKVHSFEHELCSVCAAKAAMESEQSKHVFP